MLQIILTPETLSVEQREAVASFIRSFPTVDEHAAHIPAFTVAPDEEPSPESVFAPGPVLVPTPPAATPPAGVQVDKHGLPWDERIHTGSKAMNADGSWRRKRSVDDATVTQVEAQLRTLMAIPVAPVAAAEPAPPPPVAAEPVAPPPPPPPPATFMDVLNRISELMSLKKITMDQTNTVLLKNGLDSLPLLNSRPDLAPQVLSDINALVA